MKPGAGAERDRLRAMESFPTRAACYCRHLEPGGPCRLPEKFPEGTDTLATSSDMERAPVAASAT